MNYIVRHNVRHGGSSLLNYATKQNLKGMVRRILYLGGNVDTEHGNEWAVPRLQRRITISRPTPLAVAAHYDNKSMVRFLLHAGARQVIGGVRVPLAVAFAAGHESVAMILSRDLYAHDQLKANGPIVLQLAIEARFSNLVRYFLERGPGNRTCDQSAFDYSIVLFRLLEATACKGDFVKRELLEDVFQITTMLLQHNADPDMCTEQGRPAQSITTRDVASRNPDPRVRNLLSRAKLAPTRTQEESCLQTGRSLWDASEDETHAYLEDQSPVASRYAILWDFLDKPNTNLPALPNNHELEYDEHEGGSDDGDDDKRLDSSDLEALVQADIQTLKKKSEVFTALPPQSSFPQLSTPKASVRPADHRFWARAPVKIAAAPQKPVSKVPRLKKPVEVEAFPQLGRPVQVSDGTGKSIWSGFVKDESLRDKREVQQVSLRDEGVGRGESGSKKSKKKKQWVPLVI
jgi:hypothetical protein